ncbi:hypothetical protein [Carboxydocella sp. ULO1]|uniref:hypothetical protein n=1 Tax=Carboxydocella sp. ULO1 TaxID=1926599 RepID=UPI0009D526F0|nr:hypothetical protein [Carboxydocella sp. ULO1]GAW29883.1 hypothetical protein ULO1_24530 [Carboxydocella sp. ULO1]
MTTIHKINATLLVYAFFLLYPFYLRDKQPQRYKGIWLEIGTLFRNRYGALIVLNITLGLTINFIIKSYTNNGAFGFISMIVYYLIFSTTFLWYPFYLKEKKASKYKGIWKVIGDWIGDPRSAFPHRKR